MSLAPIPIGQCYQTEVCFRRLFYLDCFLTDSVVVNEILSYVLAALFVKLNIDDIVLIGLCGYFWKCFLKFYSNLN